MLWSIEKTLKLQCNKTLSVFNLVNDTKQKNQLVIDDIQILIFRLISLALTHRV